MTYLRSSVCRWTRCTSGGTCGSGRRLTGWAGTLATTRQRCVLGCTHRTPMAGNIQRRPDGKWRARYRDANHREHARHFSRKRDAEQWLASHEVAIARGEWVDPALSKITVGEWLPRWLALQVQLKPTTMVTYEVALRRQILPRWELVPLSRITHSDVSRWVHGLIDEGLAPATVRYVHRVLSPALTAAVQDGRLVRN